MYSYVIEFNLDKRGDDAQEFLADAARTWPGLWGGIPGVTGTLLLSSALALGGDYAYQWRVDIESPRVLAKVDAALKSDDKGWRTASRDWFNARNSARAHVSVHVAGTDKYCDSGAGRDGAIHFAFHANDSGANRLADAESVDGVLAAQALRPIIGAPGSGEQTWLRLSGLDDLDRVAEQDFGIGNGRLFGEIREIDGSLFTGA